MSEETPYNEEKVHRDARLATAREFGIPLWVVEVNEICYLKEAEWFYLYEEGVFNVSS